MKNKKLLETLGDIHVAAEIIKEVEHEDKDINEIDAQYKKMSCSIVHLPKEDPRYDDLIKCITTTHGSTHNFKIKPLDVFEVKREGESKKFNYSVGNRKLLWHGSRFSNWGRILSQGLRIAPPEAPVTGHMFGKGIYFADVVSKSAQYCHPDISNHEGILALWEVAVGNHIDLKNGGYDSLNFQSKYQSAKGIGRWYPTTKIQIDGIDAYHGPLKEQNHGGSLIYNEFITYDVSNVQLKYLFRCEIK